MQDLDQEMSQKFFGKPAVDQKQINQNALKLEIMIKGIPLGTMVKS